MSQNLYKLFTDDPVEATMKNLKTQVFIRLITILRKTNKTQAELAKHLGITQPRISNLFHGKLELFALEMLIEFTVRMGYEIDTRFDAGNVNKPMVISLNKSK